MLTPTASDPLSKNGLSVSCEPNLLATENEQPTFKRILFSWINKPMKIKMSDGRILIGIFLCTDREANVILGSCREYLKPEVCGFSDEPRLLGLVMVPGRHIVTIQHDSSNAYEHDLP